MQIFNLINCRKLGMRDFNIFERFFHNNQFLFILLITIVAQVLQIQYFDAICMTHQLSREEWGGCVFMGSTVLAIAQLSKLLPDTLMDKVPISKLIDENKTMSNRVLSMWKGEMNPQSDSFTPIDNEEAEELDKKEDNDDFKELP